MSRERRGGEGTQGRRVVRGPLQLRDEVHGMDAGPWGDEARTPSWPETTRGLNPQPRHFEGDREPEKVFKQESDMTLTPSIQHTFIESRQCGVKSAPAPAAPSSPTHTLSMSMRLLCRRFPSWSSRAFSSLICSASSWFRSNSAGNAEIQYLQGVGSHPRQPFPPPPSLPGVVPHQGGKSLKLWFLSPCSVLPHFP